MLNFKNRVTLNPEVTLAVVLPIRRISTLCFFNLFCTALSTVMLIAVTFINTACYNRFIVSILITIGNRYLLTHYFTQMKILIEVDHLQGVTNPYIQIKGTNKEIVSSAASALSLDGSYTTKVLKMCS
jgi:hypothetical protein